MADDRQRCAGCGTVQVRWQVTIYDTWDMPREEGQRRSASRVWCERCWELLDTQIRQAERLATMREGQGR